MENMPDFEAESKPSAQQCLQRTKGLGPGSDRNPLQCSLHPRCAERPLLPHAGGNGDRETRAVVKGPFVFYLNSSDQIKIHVWVCFCSPCVSHFPPLRTAVSFQAAFAHTDY